jgi:hypothetical protein
VPDKDADGLCAGVIVHRTLAALGLARELISTHIVSKGVSIHDESERELMSRTYQPHYMIVLDQGSRASPPLIDNAATKCLIIDHHLSDAFPQDAVIVSACQHPPIAPASLLTYHICSALHPCAESFEKSSAYLACIGTHGDLGSTLKWLSPFPDLTATLKAHAHTKTAIHTAISLVNAPRRTSRYDVATAWSALLASTAPQDLQTEPRLREARAEIAADVERHAHTAPRFTPDGRIAVLSIHAASQIHPVIATRWAAYLTSRALEMVLVANTGYAPGKVHFSCRVARCARARAAQCDGGAGAGVDVIALLNEVVAGGEPGLRQRLGDGFARGHREASGGVVPVNAFDELMAVMMRVGEGVEHAAGRERKRKRVIEGSGSGSGRAQRNTLANYFMKT